MALSESGRFHAHLQTGDRLWLADVVPVDKLADSTRALQWQGRYFMQHVTTDRYGEKHGWLYSTLAGGDRTSVQAALVSSGHAMAYGDSASLWQYSTPMPARITASQAPQHLYQWREVSGRVKTVALTRSAAYLNFGMDWREDFTVWIPGSIRRQIEDSDLLDYEGSCIQVR